MFKHTRRLHSAFLGATFLGFTAIGGNASAATVGITEWMYNGSEYVELTNLTGSAIDMTGWSFDDDSRTPGTVLLSALGTLAPGESGLLVEGTAADFRTLWGLSAAVKIVGDNLTNLGRNDEINLFDNTNALVDRLTFGDQTFPGTIRTQNVSGNPFTLAAIDFDTVEAGWVLSAVGDAYGSYDAGGLIGNPGTFVPPVPLPAALPLLLSGIAGFAAFRRRV